MVNVGVGNIIYFIEINFSRTMEVFIVEWKRFGLRKRY